MLRKRAGFTVLELLTTAVIVTVLSTMAVISFQQTADNQRDDRAEANLRQLRNSMESFFLSNRTFPADLGELGLNPSDESFTYSVTSTSANNFVLAASRNGGNYSFTIDRDGNLTQNEEGGTTVTPGVVEDPPLDDGGIGGVPGSTPN